MPSMGMGILTSAGKIGAPKVFIIKQPGGGAYFAPGSIHAALTDVGAFNAQVTNTACDFDVGKNAAGSFALMIAYGVISTSGWSATPLPAANSLSNNGSACRTVNPYTGTFSAGTWVVNIMAGAIPVAVSGSGTFAFRFYRSTDPAGVTNNTEFTTSLQQTTTWSNLGVAQVGQKITTANVLLPEVQFNNEYFFIQIAAQITVASGSNSAVASIIVGGDTQDPYGLNGKATNGAFALNFNIITPDFIGM